MKPDLSDKQMFKIYQNITLPDPPQDLMAAAESADLDGDLGGDLSFLAEPLGALDQPPASLMARAQALGPRSQQTVSWWKQALAAVATLAAFGSGSYALASGLSVEVETEIFDTSLDTSEGFFESAGGYFADAWEE